MDIFGKQADFDFEYPIIGDKQSLFIASIDLRDNDILAKLKTKTPRIIYLFGGKVPDGIYTRMNYVAVEVNTLTASTTQHYLAQYRSIFWKREEDQTGGKMADMLAKKICPSLYRYPKWRIADMSWPTCKDNLFYFAKQIYIPENKTTKAHFTFGTSLFAFVYVTDDDEFLIQLTFQNTSEQTAEDHYKLEENICEFEQNHQDVPTIHRLIKGSKKDFQEYLLDSPYSNQEVFALLVQEGKTKKIKTEAEKRLKKP